MTFILIAQIHAMLRENKKSFHYFLCIKYVTYWKSVIKKLIMDAREIKEYRKKHNLTQNELAQITKCSLRAVQYWEKGEHKMPSSALEWLKMYNHSHNEATHNINSNGNNNTPQQQDSQVQTQENNIYSEMIATQRELIDTLKEQNSQYRKEIEYLRQKIKGYVEKSKK